MMIEVKEEPSFASLQNNSCVLMGGDGCGNCDLEHFACFPCNHKLCLTTCYDQLPPMRPRKVCPLCGGNNGKVVLTIGEEPSKEKVMVDSNLNDDK